MKVAIQDFQVSLVIQALVEKAVFQDGVDKVDIQVGLAFLVIAAFLVTLGLAFLAIQEAQGLAAFLVLVAILAFLVIAESQVSQG